MPSKEISGDFDIIGDYTIWFPADCLSADVDEIGTEDGVSVNDIFVSDRAVFDVIVTYHSLKIAFRWSADHCHEAVGPVGVLDLFLGEAFVVLANSVD